MDCPVLADVPRLLNFVMVYASGNDIFRLQICIGPATTRLTGVRGNLGQVPSILTHPPSRREHAGRPPGPLRARPAPRPPTARPAPASRLGPSQARIATRPGPHTRVTGRHSPDPPARFHSRERGHGASLPPSPSARTDRPGWTLGLDPLSLSLSRRTAPGAVAPFDKVSVGPRPPAPHSRAAALTGAHLARTVLSARQRTAPGFQPNSDHATRPTAPAAHLTIR